MKTKHLSLRISDDDHAAIKDAADAAGRTVSEHLRKSALSSEAVTVPELNRAAWQELARAVANLNQLARAANRFRRARPEPDDLADLLTTTREVVTDIRDAIEQVRRALYGAAPIEQAAKIVDNYRRASSLHDYALDRDELDELADGLRRFADAIGEDT